MLWTFRTDVPEEKYAGDVVLFKTMSAEDLFGESLAETMKRKTYKIAESHPAIISMEDLSGTGNEKAAIPEEA